MRVDDLFSSHNGLRDLLITFRQAGRYLNVPENDLGGLISSAHSLSRPITILILGDDASGKSTFINNFFEGNSLALHKGVAGPKIWKFGETSKIFQDDDFAECYLPEPILKRINFIEYPVKQFEEYSDQIKKSYLVSDIVFLIVPAIDPWSIEIYDFISDLEIIATRPFACVLTHSDLRTDEENRAFIEYISGSSKNSLGFEVPIFMVPISKYYQNSNTINEGLSVLVQWINDTIKKKNSFCKNLSRAENSLASATQRIAKFVEDSSRIDNSMAEDIEMIEKLIELSSDEIVHELSECLYDDLQEFEKTNNMLREFFEKLMNIPIATFIINRKLRETFELLSDSINESSEKIISTFTRIEQEINSCSELRDSELHELINECCLTEKKQSNTFKTWYDRKKSTLIDQFKDSYIEHFSSILLASNGRIIPRFFLFSLVLLLITFIYLKQIYSLSPFILTAMASIILGINFVLLLNQRKKILSNFDEVSSQFRNKLKDVLGNHYRLTGETFFEPHQESRESLQKLHEKQSKKILEAKECVLNAVENAKSLLAKS